MSEPFIGEIRIVSFSYAPRYWATCDGQTMAIAQNQALFSILGTTYGGNGTSTFQLPDLRGRMPYHWGTTNSGTTVLGQTGGVPGVVLNTNQIPVHTHLMQGSKADANKSTPAGNLPAVNSQKINNYGVAKDTAEFMNPLTIGAVGGGAHNNMPPYLVVNFIIALAGIFPSRN